MCPDSPSVSKPANEVPPYPHSVPVPGRSLTANACEPYFDFIELSLSKKRNTPRSARATSMEAGHQSGLWVRVAPNAPF